MIDNVEEKTCYHSFVAHVDRRFYHLISVLIFLFVLILGYSIATNTVTKPPPFLQGQLLTLFQCVILLILLGMLIVATLLVKYQGRHHIIVENQDDAFALSNPYLDLENQLLDLMDRAKVQRAHNMRTWLRADIELWKERLKDTAAEGEPFLTVESGSDRVLSCSGDADVPEGEDNANQEVFEFDVSHGGGNWLQIESPQPFSPSYHSAGPRTYSVGSAESWSDPELSGQGTGDPSNFLTYNSDDGHSSDFLTAVSDRDGETPRTRRKKRKHRSTRSLGVRPLQASELPLSAAGPPTVNSSRSVDESGEALIIRRFPTTPVYAATQALTDRRLRRQSVSARGRLTNTGSNVGSLVGSERSVPPEEAEDVWPKEIYYGDLKITLIGGGAARINEEQSPTPFETALFKGTILVRVKDAIGAPETPYFEGRSRSFSFQVKGCFKRAISGNSVYYGAYWTKRVHYPMGFPLAIKFASTIDPGLIADYKGENPSFTSPLLCAMNELEGPGVDAEMPAGKRRSFFKEETHRLGYTFVPHAEYTFEMYGNVMNWNSFDCQLGLFSVNACRFLNKQAITMKAIDISTGELIFGVEFDNKKTYE